MQLFQRHSPPTNLISNSKCWQKFAASLRFPTIVNNFKILAGKNVFFFHKTYFLSERCWSRQLVQNEELWNEEEKEEEVGERKKWKVRKRLNIRNIAGKFWVVPRKIACRLPVWALVSQLRQSIDINDDVSIYYEEIEKPTRKKRLKCWRCCTDPCQYYSHLHSNLSDIIRVHRTFILTFLCSCVLRVYWHTVIWYQMFQSNINILHIVEEFQVFLSKTRNFHIVVWFQVYIYNANNL